jgi:putative transposase
MTYARSGVQIMPSRRRYCAAGYPVQVLQRDNDRQLGFAQVLDLAAHSGCLKVCSAQYNVHLLLTPQIDSGISQLMQTLGLLYVGYFTKMRRLFWYFTKNRLALYVSLRVD